MLSRQSLEILLDLVEIKLSSMIVQDKEDIKELRKLKNVVLSKNRQSATIQFPTGRILCYYQYAGLAIL